MTGSRVRLGDRVGARARCLPCCALALLACFAGPAYATQSAAAQRPPQNDTRTWYQAYADGVREATADNADYETALASLLRAKQLGPTPGRNVPTYGDSFVDFLPDYYLGVAYLGLGNYGAAVNAFKVARGYIAARDPEFAQLNAQDQRAQQGAQDRLALAQQRPADLTPSPANAAAANPAAPADAGQPPAASPTQSAAVQQAPVPGTAASAPGLTNPRPAPAVVPPARAGAVVNRPGPSPPSTTPAAVVTEKDAIAQFLSGRYSEADAILSQLVAAKRQTPRVLLYLASARAAMVLTGEADAATLADEQARFASLDLGAFTEDLRYISPHVLRELRGQE